MAGMMRRSFHRRLLAVVLGLAVTVPAAAETIAGPTDEARPFAGRPLVEVLHDLESRGLRLIYSSDIVRDDMRIQEEPPRTGPRAILDALLAPHGLEAREGPGGTLLVVRRPASETTGAIGGIVRTREGGRPVAAARVLVEGTTLETSTAQDGTFRLGGLLPAAHLLIVKVTGLRDERFAGVTVRAGEVTEVFLDLAGRPLILERIVVKPGGDPSIDGRPDSGSVLDGEAIRRAPGLGDDVHRVLAAQPGIASGDRSAEISVRGGAANEVLVLFDGMELYDPFHLKSFQRFSGIIDTATLGSAEYFAGAFPVEYGDRMSGVLDLSSAVPASPGETLVGASFINSRFMTDGTFLGGAGNWLVSGRAWYPDAVVRTTDREDEGFAPSYSDLLGKIQVPAGERTVLVANVLAARDDVGFTDPDGAESVDAGSSTRYTWLGLTTLWSPRLYSRTLFSIGRNQSERNGRIDEDAEFSASVSDQRWFDVAGLGQDWGFQASDRLLLKWGFGAKRLEGEYKYTSVSIDQDGTPGNGTTPIQSTRDIVLEPSGNQFAAYVSGQFRPMAPLRLEVGLRWDRQTYTGEDQVSPRVSLVQDLGPAARIRAAWGRYHQSQGIHELQVEDGVSDFFPAQMAEQWSIGYEREFGHGWTFRADGYVKEMSNLRPRFENLFNPFELLPEFEPDRVRIAPDRARARGLDLAVAMKRGGPLSWWAAYSWSEAEDTIDGQAVRRSWDQPHAFRFGVDLRGGDRWDLALSGLYHTGWPTTAVGAVAIEGPDGTTTYEPVPGPRNGARYPAYHRLDLRAGRHFRLGGGRLTVFAEITNLYDRDNVCCVEDFTFLPQTDGSVRVDREDGFWLERIPSLGIVWRFDH